MGQAVRYVPGPAVRAADEGAGASPVKLADLSRAVDVVVADLLAVDGFRRRQGVLVRELDVDEGAAGWLGLNRAVRQGDGVVHVNPVVGVRHRGVETLIAELHPNEKPPRRMTPTISTSIGYLGPDRSFAQWDFHDEADLDRVGASLVDAVRTYGMPFMTQHRTLTEIAEALRTGMSPVPEQRAERLIATLHLAGETEAARVATEAFVAMLGRRADPAAVRAQEFVHHFRATFSPA